MKKPTSKELHEELALYYRAFHGDPKAGHSYEEGMWAFIEEIEAEEGVVR